MYNEQLSQALALMDWITFTNAAAASYNSVNGIDMSKFKRAVYIVQTGLFTASGTLDGRIQSSPNANFSPAHNVAATNLTTLNTSNTFEKVEVRAEYIQQQNPGDRYVRLNTTVGTAAVNYGVVGLGSESEQKPASQYENPSNATNVVAAVVN